GPLFAQIKRGEQVELENGMIVDGKDFVGPPKKGRIITIIGDTRLCDQAYELAQDADILVHEATFSMDNKENAYEFYHSTTVDAAQVALQSDVKKLIMTHIS